MHRTRSGGGRTLHTKTRSVVKVKVIPKWYVTLHHHKMHSHNKLDPYLKEFTLYARRTDGQCNYYKPPKVPLGHTNDRLCESNQSLVNPI